MKKDRVLRIVITVLLALAMCAASFTAGFFVSKCSRSERASLRWGVNTINKNYYFGEIDEDLTDTTLAEVAAKYLDRYSAYYTAKEYKEVMKSNAGSKSGLGLSYSYAEGRGVYVASVVINSPAYMCGLRKGVWLESGGFEGGAQKDFGSAEDFSKLVGSAAEGRKLSFTSSDGETYVTAKAEYTASYAYMCTNESAWIFGDAATGGLALYENVSERIDYLPDGFAYIRLTQFYGSAAAEFVRLTEKFNSLGCDSLILDLRSNGGGYVSVMQDIAGVFTDGEKPAMISRDKRGGEERFLCADVKPSQRISSDVEVYVLANAGTASASEALIGAMYCYGAIEYSDVYLSDYSKEYTDWLLTFGQEVKNARSYGKGIMQSTFVNSATGEALKLTTAKIYWPDGVTCIHDKGLNVADGCVAVDAAWEHTLPDDELKAAVGMRAG